MERVSLNFEFFVNGKLAAIIPSARFSKMRRLIFCPCGFIPEKGKSYWANIFPAGRYGSSTFIYEDEELHIYNCELENEAGIFDRIDALEKSSPAADSVMARALQTAQEKSGKEIPIAGQLKLGEDIILEVNGRTDTRTGHPAFFPAYFEHGDPLIKGENSMRIFHATYNPRLASNQSWVCKVENIRPSEKKNIKGYQIINIRVRPLTEVKRV